MPKSKRWGGKIDDIVESLEFIKDYLANRVPTIDMVATKADVIAVKADVIAVREDIKKLDVRLTRVEASAVTKDYLDIKLADLRGDLVVLTRKEDNKVKSLIDILKKKKVITNSEARQVLKMEPFAQI
jgi:hypothetical protein